MRKLPSRKILATLIAGAFFIPQTSFSLGLGEIEVSSALNQKLKADIELLSATPEDTETIIVKLASRKEFSRAGLDRPYSLNNLRFKSEVIDGVPHIIVSSSSPIREPFLNFLVEVDWPNGHLLREYTVLLDPPVFMTKTASAVSSGAANNGSANTRPAALPVSAQVSFTPSSVSNSSSTSPRSSSAPVVQQQTSGKQRLNNYRIKSGDTAWKLADSMRPNQSVTVPQMMFALLRSNPSAFIDENINGLKRGFILRVPNASQIAEISKAEAKALTREHWALWRQYQQAQAGEQPVTAMPAANQAADQAASVDSAKATDGESSGVAGGSHLAIVSAGSGTSTSGSKDLSAMTAQELRAELTLARERVESERVEKEALQSRINTLEQIAENREGLLVVEANELSGVQALNTPVDETAVFTDEVSPQVAEEGSATEAEIAVPDSVATANASALENNVSTPSDPLSTLLNNPVLLAAASGGLLLIVAIIALILKRRKTGSDNDEPDKANGLVGQEGLDEDVKKEAVGADDSAADEHAVADAEEAENSDSGSTKNQDLSDTADATESDALVTDEADDSSDDVIAEADVYLAYGIYQQAEDLIKQALLENPERDDYRLKLAEIHFASKNTVAFVEVAGEIKNRTENENSVGWKKVLVMGQELCANDPLFNEGPDVEQELDEQPIDAILGINEELVGASGSDLKLDEELKLPDMDVETSETGIDSGLATNELSDEVPEEIEFDLSDTGAHEENKVEEDVSALDISAAELDIFTQDGSTQDDSDDAAETDETLAGDEIDITFDLDDNPDSDTEVEEEISLDLSDEILAESDAEFENIDDETSKEFIVEEEVSLDLSDEIEAEAESEVKVKDSQSEAVDEDTHVTDESVVNESAVEESVDDVNVVTVAAANDNSGDEGDFDLTNLDDFDEVSTKLDLARAYLDMGDHDGTRGILEEVMVDGTDEQKQEANELMERLAS